MMIAEQERRRPDARRTLLAKAITMRLLDLLMFCKGNVVIDLPRVGRFEMPGAGKHCKALRDTPSRYVLADNVRALCDRMPREWPDLFDPSRPQLRLPVERLWLEWQRPGPAILTDPGTQRCALLVEGQADGRRGIVQSFWEDPVHGIDRGQVAVDFDLDATGGLACDGCSTFPLPKACPPALRARARFRLDPAWRDYFLFNALPDSGLAGVVEECGRRTWTDLLMLLAFSQLLALSAPLRKSPVRRDRLNAARARRGEAPLLDHVEAALALAQPVVPCPASGGMAYGSRRHARLHVVRGHLVRRSGGFHWRSTHLRGSGAGTLARNVEVRL